MKILPLRKPNDIDDLKRLIFKIVIHPKLGYYSCITTIQRNWSIKWDYRNNVFWIKYNGDDSLRNKRGKDFSKYTLLNDISKVLIYFNIPDPNHKYYWTSRAGIE